MIDDNKSRGNIYNANDTLDINELASLNDDITPEFIEQLQNQVAINASEFTGKPIINENDDSELFEEISSEESKTPINININENIDDNFMKKYKAKLNKQESVSMADNEESSAIEISKNEATTEESTQISETPSNIEQKTDNKEIKELSSGNIIETPITQEKVEYNESLDLIDDNVKYSKYVIYVAPENTEFIESLTVKERKNLINRILREQDDIALTKRRLTLVQTILKHSIIAIITLSISIPVVYWTINASLEASINNYRRSKTVFKTLYREKGKIKTNSSY